MDQGGAPPQLPGQDYQQPPQQSPQPQQQYQPVISPASPHPVPPTPMAMNWSYFKLEFSGKLEKDQETYIPRKIGWWTPTILLQVKECKDFP